MFLAVNRKVGGLGPPRTYGSKSQLSSFWFVYFFCPNQRGYNCLITMTFDLQRLEKIRCFGNTYDGFPLRQMICLNALDWVFIFVSKKLGVLTLLTRNHADPQSNKFGEHKENILAYSQIQGLKLIMF